MRGWGLENVEKNFFGGYSEWHPNDCNLVIIVPVHAFSALTLLGGHQEEPVDHPRHMTFIEEVRA